MGERCVIRLASALTDPLNINATVIIEDMKSSYES